MLDFLTPGQHSSSPTDVLIQVATLAAGLLIAAALRFGLNALRRRRAAKRLREQHSRGL